MFTLESSTLDAYVKDIYILYVIDLPNVNKYIFTCNDQNNVYNITIAPLTSDICIFLTIGYRCKKKKESLK